MNGKIAPPAIEIIGKTYSLYGGGEDTAHFYRNLSNAANNILALFDGDAQELLNEITSLDRSKRRIQKKMKTDVFIVSIMNLLHNELGRYLINVAQHLKGLTLRQQWDRRLATSYEQYLLYMIEIELTNRINLVNFRRSAKKLAFLPHCLRDFDKNCLAAPDDIDHLCRGCSKKCTINAVSRLLKKSEVTPYIWMQADLKKIFKLYEKENTRIGVLGIACIPELATGMKLCRKSGVPVVGIPLDANRCRRWMGDFYDNTVNGAQIEKLLDVQSESG
jgi:hypothetical protein